MLVWKAQKASSSYISSLFPSLKRASNTRHIRSHYHQLGRKEDVIRATHHALKSRFYDDLTNDIVQLVVCHTINPSIDISVRSSRLLISLHNEGSERTYISILTVLGQIRTPRHPLIRIQSGMSSQPRRIPNLIIIHTQ
jgi:hypothetical protein